MYIVYTQIAFNHNLIMRLRNSNTDFCVKFIGIRIFSIEIRQAKILVLNSESEVGDSMACPIQ